MAVVAERRVEGRNVERQKLGDELNRFDQVLGERGLVLERAAPEVLQVNVGKLCNLTCIHCHVNAGPKRKEIMTRETVERILDWLRGSSIATVDLTGGAPEMIPDFRYFVSEARAMGRHVMDRCNLTILLEDGYQGLAEFLCEHEVEIVASMPCYSPRNVEEQRGEGVFDGSIAALQLLNRLGYAQSEKLPLHLVYNPNGAFLPGDQVELEADYKRELRAAFGIEFNRLYSITNLPIARFASYLRHNNRYDEYMTVLREAFNPSAVAGLMCRNTISVGWQGEVYDCDFNQQLGMQLKNGKPLSLWDLDLEQFAKMPILTAEHCFGCTAGAGSSCGGALV
jgi:radical SAM/Cys-rich protein